MPQQTSRLWDWQWFRDAVFLLIALSLLWMAYSLRAILLPIIMALALAYAFHPLISWLQRRARIPRWLSTTGLLGITSALALSLILWLMPQLIDQTRKLLDKLPGYTSYATERLESIQQQWVDDLDDEEQSDAGDEASPSKSDTSSTSSTSSSSAAAPTFEEAGGMSPDPGRADTSADTDSQAQTSASAGASAPSSAQSVDDAKPDPAQQGEASPSAGRSNGGRQQGQGHPPGTSNALGNALGKLDISTISSMLVQTFNVGLGVVGVTVSIGTYLTLAVMLVVFGFFFFSWRFDRILAWFDTFIPDSRRPRIMHIIGRMDRAISAFVRGRLVQVSILMCVLCMGWAWVGVPYWLLLGVLGGLLNIVPYAAVISWPLAILLMWIDTASGSSAATFSIGQVFIWPSVVYIFAQSLDGWVVEPLVQGRATNLDPFSVLVAVIVGGSLLGIMGTIIAVPTAACLKILLEEVILPYIRLQIHGPPQGDQGSP